MLSLASGWRIVTSSVLRRSYEEAPVSPLLLFERKQDFAYQQEVGGSASKRHHVRFWRCPDGWRLPGGTEADWLAAGTYDRSVGLSLFTFQVTHKIEQNTDAERDHIVATMKSTGQPVTVATIKDFSTGYHARNGGGDSIVTDGDLPVIDLQALAVPAGADDELPTDSRDKRPSPTVIGAAFIALRAVVSALLAVQVVLDSPDDQMAVAWAVAVVLGIFALLELVVAWQVFLGRNWARVLAMSLSVLAIAIGIITAQTGGEQIDWRTNLPGLALDVLLILALSSERSLTYARRPHHAPKSMASRPGGHAAF